MVTIDATYEGDLLCHAVHGPSSSTLGTDVSEEHGGLGRRFSPSDLVATGLATCILSTIGIVAQRRGIDLQSARAHVEKHMSASPARIGRLPVELTLAGTFSDVERKVLENAAHACPVHKSLHPDIDAPIHITWR